MRNHAGRLQRPAADLRSVQSCTPRTTDRYSASANTGAQASSEVNAKVEVDAGLRMALALQDEPESGVGGAGMATKRLSSIKMGRRSRGLVLVAPTDGYVADWK
jgi:hypothetical protein